MSGFQGSSVPRRWFRVGALALLAGAAPRAEAFEGRVQISSAPYTISASGSYVLTRNLSVTAAQTAITVTADFVAIDLNGFSITGPNSCSYASGAVTCTASSVGLGIDATARQGVWVRNGRIRGTGAAALRLGDGARVEGLLVSDAGGHGIHTGRDASVVGNTVENVDGSGIVTSGSSRIVDNRVNGTETQGIVLGTLVASSASGLARGNAVVNAGDIGLDAVDGALLERNSVHASWDAGIAPENAFAVFDSVSGSAGADGFGRGMTGGSGGIFVGNAVHGSTGEGINGSTFLAMENDSAMNSEHGLRAVTLGCYGRNVLEDNNGGNAQPQVAGGAVARQNAANLCGGNTTCP